MLLKTLIFDSKNSHWTSDWRSNTWFLHATEQYINDIIRHKGYIYLNQIYEQLNVEWNPGDENPCIKKNGVNRPRYIEFEVLKQSKNSILVSIYQYI